MLIESSYVEEGYQILRSSTYVQRDIVVSFYATVYGCSAKKKK